MEAEAATEQVTDLSFELSRDSSLIIHLVGSWRMHHGLPSVGRVLHEVNQTKPRSIGFETSRLGAWDSGLLTFVARTTELGRSRNIPVALDGLPEGLVRLVELAEAVPEKKDARVKAQSAPLLQRVGTATINYAEGSEDFLAFLGSVVIAIGRMFKGQARFRNSDLMIEIQDAGVNALGIVALISFLVGTILAFMGAVQLQQFGAQIYVADLVAIGMVREMGAMMTAIIMAGRTGAAYAAALGTMKVTKEIDALTTMGISPMEFLVLPRIVALILMMPLLCVFANVFGVMGGAFVGVAMLKLALSTFLREAWNALTLGNLFGGLFKAMVYGVIVAISGCLRGFQSGSSSSAVGDAATRAVVTGIVWNVVACGIMAFLFNLLGI
ncbi:MAG TPA: ABC transporter permease [Candidatus Binataceae bacterium]|jgi:phospholipid/cholesterol/gamma-HCH transport system permease protein